MVHDDMKVNSILLFECLGSRGTTFDEHPTHLIGNRFVLFGAAIQPLNVSFQFLKAFLFSCGAGLLVVPSFLYDIAFNAASG